MIYSSWDIEHDRLKLVIIGHFLPWYPPKNPENQNSEKMKKIAGDILILHKCTKITITLCTFPEIQSETQYFLSFGTIFTLSPC